MTMSTGMVLKGKHVVHHAEHWAKRHQNIRAPTKPLSVLYVLQG